MAGGRYAPGNPMDKHPPRTQAARTAARPKPDFEMIPRSRPDHGERPPG